MFSALTVLSGSKVYCCSFALWSNNVLFRWGRRNLDVKRTLLLHPISAAVLFPSQERHKGMTRRPGNHVKSSLWRNTIGRDKKNARERKRNGRRCTKKQNRHGRTNGTCLSLASRGVSSMDDRCGVNGEGVGMARARPTSRFPRCRRRR